MAHTVATGIALNSSDFFVKLKAAIVANGGWTVVDDQVTTGASGQSYVCSSTGESGNENIILHFKRNNANGLTITSVLSWNATTHVGTKEVGSTSGTAGTGTFIHTDDNNYFQYWIFISKDRIIIVTRVGWTTGYSTMLYAGIYNRQRSSAFRTTTGALAAGANVVVALADTSIFTVGKRYGIADATNYEFPKVTAINPNVSITFDTLQNAYVTGARIGEDIRPTIISPSVGASGVNMLGIASANWWAQAAPYDGGIGIMTTGGIVVRRMIDVNLVERTTNVYGDGGPDGGGNALVNMWPFAVGLEADFDASFLGTLAEVFQIPRRAALTDDLITVGGATYRVIDSVSAVTASGDAAIGTAIRQA